MYNQNQELFVDSNSTAALLEQFLGKNRYRSFVREANDQIDSFQYRKWSADSMVDYVSAEMRKSQWIGRQPTIAEFESMVRESRRLYRSVDVELYQSNSKMFITRFQSEDDFDLAKIHLTELLSFYDKHTNTDPPDLFLSILGRKHFSEIKVVGVVSGVCLGFEFKRLSGNANAKQ
jgi:hypothetical protein